MDNFICAFKKLLLSLQHKQTAMKKPNMKKMSSNVLNAPVRFLCNHIIGQQHTDVHRCICGVVFILGGVYIAKTAALIHIMPLHLIVDGLGYGLHGIGLVPIIEILQKQTKNNNDEKN